MSGSAWRHGLLPLVLQFTRRCGYPQWLICVVARRYTLSSQRLTTVRRARGRLWIKIALVSVKCCTSSSKTREKNAFIARQGTYDLLYLDVKPPGRLYPTHPPPPAAAKYRRDDHEEMPPPLHASQRQRLQVIRREGSARPVHPLKVTRC